MDSDEKQIFNEVSSMTNHSFQRFRFFGIGMMIFFILFVYLMFRTVTTAYNEPFSFTPISFIGPFLILIVLFAIFGFANVMFSSKQATKSTTNIMGSIGNIIAKERESYQQFDPMNKYASTTKSLMYCPNCGQQIASDSSFCKFCGANIKNYS